MEWQTIIFVNNAIGTEKIWINLQWKSVRISIIFEVIIDRRN